MGPRRRSPATERPAEVCGDLVAMIAPSREIRSAWGPGAMDVGITSPHVGCSLDALVHPDDSGSIGPSIDRLATGGSSVSTRIKLRSLSRRFREVTLTAVRSQDSDGAVLSLVEDAAAGELVARVATAVSNAWASASEHSSDPIPREELTAVLSSTASALDADAVWISVLYVDHGVRWDLRLWDDRRGGEVGSAIAGRFSRDDASISSLASLGRRRLTMPDDEARLGSSLLAGTGLRTVIEVAAPLETMPTGLLLVMGAGAATTAAWRHTEARVDASLRLVGALVANEISQRLGPGSDRRGEAEPGVEVVLSTELRILNASVPFTEEVGAPFELLLGARLEELVDVEDRPRLAAALERLDDTPEEGVGVDGLRLHAGTTARWDLVLEASSPSRTGGRLISARFFRSGVQSASARALPAPERFGPLLDALSDAAFVFDAEGSVVYANERARTTFSEYRHGGRWEFGAFGIKVLDAAKPVGISGRRLRFNSDFMIRSARRTFTSQLVVDTNRDGSIGTVTVLMIDRTEQRESAAELSHRSSHDALTNLPNRTAFVDMVARAIETIEVGSEVAVLMIDPDRFKLVNDSLGHLAGDQLLTEVARRLRAEIRPEDGLARVGADEFGVLVRRVEDDGELCRLVQRLQGVVADTPIRAGDREVPLSVCVGEATTADASMAAEELLRRADAALSRAKATGAGNADRFDDRLQDQVVRRLEFDERLRLALHTRELEVYFQPEIDLDSGRLLGVEALLRWIHPELGRLSLGQFADVAEDTEVMTHLGRWVLAQACKHALRWRERVGDQFVLRVNMSARELQSDGVVDAVARTLGEVGYPPAGLCIELTETAIMSEAAATARLLDDLHALGVELAIDDFGTGYSSLSYLKRFPVDILKIDQSFVAGLPSGEDRAIIATVIALADALGLGVTAEGVERPDQRDVLVNLGCLRGQGFLFAPPMDAAAIDAVIADGFVLKPRKNPSPEWDPNE